MTDALTRICTALGELQGGRVSGATTWGELDRLDSLDLLEVAALANELTGSALADLTPPSPAQTVSEWVAMFVAAPPRASGDERARVRLRELHPTDVEWLRHLTCRPGDAHRWRFRGEAPNLDVFVGALGAGVLVQYVVEAADGSAPVGLVTAYGANLTDGVVSIAVLTDDRYRRTFDMLEGVGRFLALLFDTWPFRKVYADIPAFNLDSDEAVLGGLFTLEGRLTAHAYHAGRYWDVSIYAVTRERFADVGTPLVR